MNRSIICRLVVAVGALVGILVLALIPALSPVRGQMPGVDVPPPALQTETPTPTPTPAPLVPVTTTADIAAENDASVVSGGSWTADTNLGGWAKLAVGSQSGGVYRSYLRFDLDNLPPNILIVNARLLLTPAQTGFDPMTITANAVAEAWSEGTVTWNQQPLTTLLAGAATWNPNQPTSPFAIDVTQAARTWYACGGSVNDGLQLSADTANDWVVFGSRKSANAPTLEITYESTTVPISCVAAPTTGSSQAPSQPAPSTSGAQIGSVNPNSAIASATPCPQLVCSFPTSTAEPKAMASAAAANPAP